MPTACDNPVSPVITITVEPGGRCCRHGILRGVRAYPLWRAIANALRRRLSGMV
ncbi:hypothetical protein WCU84_08615 [Dickeya chrysanthemi]|uniref:Uncharacterized protein n=1 Tax=Dickeya chrysanthemi TaxID=556 RepID=A0ABU8JKU1_DICCH